MQMVHASLLISQCTSASFRRIKGSVTISPMAKKSIWSIKVLYNRKMQTMRETIMAARAAGHAVGHFNFSDSNQLKAIAMAAKQMGMPIIAALSEGEREYFPFTHARLLVDQYQKEGIQIYLNSDHTYSLEKTKAAIDAGVDGVVVDGAKLPFNENVELLKQCVAYARASGRDVVMEGELGYIGQSSKQLTSLPEGVTEANLTTPEDAKKFIE